MNRAYLIALRELVENLKTKGFWLGILTLPILLMLSTLAPSLLDKAKSARTYAVIDHSGFLLEAIESRAQADDFSLLLATIAQNQREQKKLPAEIPVELEAMAAGLTSLTGAQLQQFAGILSGTGEPQQGNGLPAELLHGLPASRPVIQKWWQSLSPTAAKEINPRLAKARFRRIAAPSTAAFTEKDLAQKLQDKDIFAFFVIEVDPVTEGDASRYISNNQTDDDLRDWFSGLTNRELRPRRLAREHIQPSVAEWIATPLRYQKQKLSTTGEAEKVSRKDKLRQWIPLGFVYLLWISIFSISQSLLTNTVTEKSSRILEVLLSSASPTELMAGKISGAAATGLILAGSWMLVFVAGAHLLPRFFQLPGGLDLAAVLADPMMLTAFMVYFLLGYLFYSAVLVGLGSVCDSLKDAQSLATPVNLFLFIPLFLMLPVGKDPNGLLAQVMSYVPPLTPFVMLNRMGGGVSWIEVLVTTLLLIASIALALWAAAKVFRVGVLLTGKPPKLREILRWIKAPAD